MVYVEFLLAFVPTFTLFLGTVQFALIATANVAVQRGADAAARAAIAVLDAPPCRIDAGSASSNPRMQADYASKRHRMIRSTAVAAMASFMPTASSSGNDSVAKAVGAGATLPIEFASTDELVDSAFGRRMAVILTDGSAGGSEVSSFVAGADDLVTVGARVSVPVECSVPIANRLLCGAGGMAGSPIGISDLGNRASPPTARSYVVSREAALPLIVGRSAYRDDCNAEVAKWSWQGPTPTDQIGAEQTASDRRPTVALGNVSVTYNPDEGGGDVPDGCTPAPQCPNYEPRCEDGVSDVMSPTAVEACREGCEGGWFGDLFRANKIAACKNACVNDARAAFTAACNAYFATQTACEGGPICP